MRDRGSVQEPGLLAQNYNGRRLIPQQSQSLGQRSWAHMETGVMKETMRVISQDARSVAISVDLTREAGSGLGQIGRG